MSNKYQNFINTMTLTDIRKYPGLSFYSARKSNIKIFPKRHFLLKLYKIK